MNGTILVAIIAAASAILGSVVTGVINYWVTMKKIVFSRLQERTAEIISLIYEKLTRLEIAMESYFKPVEWTGEPSRAEKLKEFEEAYSNLAKYFTAHTIYLKIGLCDKIRKFLDKSYKLSRDFATRDLDRTHGWLKVWEEYKTEIPQIKIELEKEFRELLGVER